MSRVRIDKVLHDDDPDGVPEWEYEGATGADAAARSERPRQAASKWPELPSVDIDLVRTPCSLSATGTCTILARLQHVSWIGRTPTYTVLLVVAPHECGGGVEADAILALGGQVCGRAAARLRRNDTWLYMESTQATLRERAARFPTEIVDDD